MAQSIFKICRQEEWTEAERAGSFLGSAVDFKDGYIHFSTAAKVAETARLHFASQSGLLLVAIDPEPLGPALRWEPARDGTLFPHLYAPLPVQHARWVKALPLGGNGLHIFPELGD